MKSRNPSVSANAEPAPLAGEPERVISSRSRPQRPSSVSLTRASSAFYGIAATGSYRKLDSLRDAPPGGEAFNLPLRGRGTAAAVEEGRYGRERCVFISRSRSERPSSVRANALPAPPKGKLLPSPPGKGDRRSGGRGVLRKRAVRNFQPLPPGGEASCAFPRLCAPSVLP